MEITAIDHPKAAAYTWLIDYTFGCVCSRTISPLTFLIRSEGKSVRSTICSEMSFLLPKNNNNNNSLIVLSIWISISTLKETIGLQLYIYSFQSSEMHTHTETHTHDMHRLRWVSCCSRGIIMALQLQMHAEKPSQTAIQPIVLSASLANYWRPSHISHNSHMYVQCRFSYDWCALWVRCAIIVIVWWASSVSDAIHLAATGTN